MTKQNNDESIKLMEIYLNEWKHRDNMFWKQVSTYFFAVLIVIILPFSNIWDIDLSFKIPNFVFPLIGMVLSLVFLVIGKSFADRLTWVSKTYESIINMLPKKYRRKEVHNPKLRLVYFVVYIMFVILFGLSLLILHLAIIK